VDPRERYPITGAVAVVPIEWLPFFIEDPVNSAMEYLSFPSGAVNPFFRDIGKVSDAIYKDIPNPLNWKTYTLDKDFEAGKDKRPRYMHIDLAINNDGAGIAMSHCSGYKAVHTRTDSGEFGQVMLPIIKFDFAGILRPRKEYNEKEIDYDAIMVLLFDIADRGFNVMGGLLTFDRFQSHHMKTTLHKSGFNVASLSVDHTTSKLIVDYNKPDRVRKEPISRQPAAAMLSFRDAVYQDRVIIPVIEECPSRPGQSWLEKEAMESQSVHDGVQRLLKAEKIEGGSDDILQAIAGSCFNCVNNDLGFTEFEEIVHSPSVVKREMDFYAQFGRTPQGDQIPKRWIEESDYESERGYGRGSGDEFYLGLEQSYFGL